MSDKSSIEWCDATWNPVTGCTKVSEGCRHCYAATFAERWRGTPGHYFENGFDLTLRPDKLDQPLKWKKARKIFVNSMSDLFHKDVPDQFIAEAFAVMSIASQHTFQVLTKRPERMGALLNSAMFWLLVNSIRWGKGLKVLSGSSPYILPNVWLGTSVENQKAADERIPLLLQTPAAIRFLSCEPLLGPINLFDSGALEGGYAGNEFHAHGNVDWVIVGGESGHGARPMHPDWAISIRNQCQAAGVSFFFKQWGEWLPNAQMYDCAPEGFDFEKKHQMMGDVSMCKAGKGVSGRKIDGREWNEFPEVKS